MWYLAALVLFLVGGVMSTFHRAWITALLSFGLALWVTHQVLDLIS